MSYDSWKLATPPEYEESTAPETDEEGANVWWDDIWEHWCACWGDYDLGEHVGTGKTRAEAVDALKEMEGQPYPDDGVEYPFAANH